MSGSAHWTEATSGTRSGTRRLQSWKEIATYFGRSVRTVQRWEARGGLPVYRLPGRLGSVYADEAELEAWWSRHRTRLEAEGPPVALPPVRSPWPWLTAALAALLLVTVGLLVPLVVRSAPRSVAGRPVDPGVREAYLRGRLFLDSPTEEETTKAIDSFQEAIRKDPAHAPAYAGLARAHLAAANVLVPTRQAMAPAKAAALKALVLDPSLGEAYTSRGLLRAALDWDLPGSETDLRRAVEIDPADAWAHLYLGFAFLLQGRRDEGLAEVERAQQQDPLSVKINARLGMTYAFLGRHEQALGQCRKALDIDKNAGEAHACVGYVFERKGTYADAVREYERAAELGYRAAPQVARVTALAGREAEARRRLDLLKEEWRRRRAWSPYEIAKVCHALGDEEEAFTWLETAYQEHDQALIALSVEPEWEGLRAHSASRANAGP
jgi:tetratricopeptide (TPR) repeat protein